jgi:hypothetical protein
VTVSGAAAPATSGESTHTTSTSTGGRYGY